MSIFQTCDLCSVDGSVQSTIGYNVSSQIEVTVLSAIVC